jgi:YbbR domain-containing protein
MKILNNLSIKLLSVLAALLLWVFVVGVENYVFALPIEQTVKVNNLGQNVSVANEINKVKIKYKTADSSSPVPTAAEFELYVDAGNLNEGQHLLPINFLSKNPKITIVAVEPANLELLLEANSSKEIPVKNQVNGLPAKDYELKEIKLDVSKIKVSGASSVVNKLTDLNLKINLDGSENADFSRKIALEAPAEWNLKGKTINFEPATVQADIKIRKKPAAEIEIPVINNGDNTENDNDTDVKVTRKTVMAQINAGGENVSSVKEILPQNLLVTVEGDESINNLVNNNTIKLNFDLSSVVKGSYTVKESDLSWDNSINLKIVEFSPEKILVKY